MQLVQQLLDCIGDVDDDVDVQSVLHAVECFLEDGFVGNRSVTDIWSLITRTCTAYPLLLYNLVETVLGNCQGQAVDKTELQRQWIVQAIFQGKLGAFISKVLEQPHIKTAYQSNACILQSDVAKEWSSVIAKLEQHPAFAGKLTKRHLPDTSDRKDPQPAELSTPAGQDDTIAGDGVCERLVQVQLLVRDMNVDSDSPDGAPTIELKVTLNPTEAVETSSHQADQHTNPSSAILPEAHLVEASPASGKGGSNASPDASKAPRPGPHPVISWGRGLFMQVLSQRSRTVSEDKEVKPEGGANTQSASADPDSSVDKVGTNAADLEAEGHASQSDGREGHQRVQGSPCIEPQQGSTDAIPQPNSESGVGAEEMKGTASSVETGDGAEQEKHGVVEGESSAGGDTSGSSLYNAGGLVGESNSGSGVHDKKVQGANKPDEKAQERNKPVEKAQEGNKPPLVGHSAANRWLGALFRRTHQHTRESKQDDKPMDLHAAEGAETKERARPEVPDESAAVVDNEKLSQPRAGQAGREGAQDTTPEKQAEGAGRPPPPLAAAGRLLHNISRRSVDEGTEPKLLHLSIRVLHDGDNAAEPQSVADKGADRGDEDTRLVEVTIKLAEDNRLEHHVRAWSQAAAQVAVGAAGVIAQQAAHKAPILWQYIREHAEQHLMIVPPPGSNRGNEGREDGSSGISTEQIPIQQTPEYKDGVKEADELLQQLQQCVDQLFEVESNSKFVLGDECTVLITLCQLVEKVLHHGLRSEYQWTQQWIKSQPLLAWIPTPHPHPFAMLGELQKGRRQGRGHGPNQQQPDNSTSASSSLPHDPPVDLGVDAIHGMRMAAGVNESTKLQLWIRVSLNQQLLGKRMRLLFEYTHRRGNWQRPQSEAPGETAAACATSAAEAEDAGAAGQSEVKTPSLESLSGSPIDAWFHPWALLRLEKNMEEAVMKLAMVDGVRSLLAVDVQSVRPAAIKPVTTTGDESHDPLSGAQFDWPISPTSTFSEADSTAAAAAPTVTLGRAPSLSRSSKGREKRVVEIQTAGVGREQAFSPRSSGGVLSPVSSSDFNLDMFDQLAVDVEAADPTEWMESSAQMVEPLTTPSGLKLPSLDLLSVLQPKAIRKPSPKKHPAIPTSLLHSGSCEGGASIKDSPLPPDVSSSAKPPPKIAVSSTGGASTESGIPKDTALPTSPVLSPGTRQQREAVDAVLASMKQSLHLEGVALEPEVLEGQPVTADDHNPLLMLPVAAAESALGSDEEAEAGVGQEEDGSERDLVCSPHEVAGAADTAGITAVSSDKPKVADAASHSCNPPDQSVPFKSTTAPYTQPIPSTAASQLDQHSHSSSTSQPQHSSPASTSMPDNCSTQHSQHSIRTPPPLPGGTSTSLPQGRIAILDNAESPASLGDSRTTQSQHSTQSHAQRNANDEETFSGSAASSRRSTLTEGSADEAVQATRPVVAHRRSSSGQNGTLLGGLVASLSVVAAHTLQDSRGGEFTVYDVRVELQDGTKYQVQHRFSDFVNLRHSLKYTVGAVLPESWSDISKARHVTGRARISNEVVHARQAMLDRCLRDLLHAPPAILNTRLMKQFLAPQTSDVVIQPNSSPSNQLPASSAPSTTVPRMQEARSTIRLQFDLSSGRSLSEQFNIQQGKCASCHRSLPALDDSYSLWRQSNTRGPRLCHYTHMLYCHDCHEGHMHIIPARILHKWDFSRHPVCVAVHEYLQAVFHQPMISVTSVNPGLYARVPTMAKAYELRHKTVLALDLARSSGPEAAAKVQKLMDVAGSRAHLLEKADFWSLRDLQDISKGAFSEIPQWLEAACQRATNIATTAVLTSKNPGK